MYGSVTAQNISDLLGEKEYAVDRRKIVLDDPIRAVGVYNIEIRLHSEVTATVKTLGGQGIAAAFDFVPISRR